MRPEQKLRPSIEIQRLTDIHRAIESLRVVLQGFETNVFGSISERLEVLDGVTDEVLGYYAACLSFENRVILPPGLTLLEAKQRYIEAEIERCGGKMPAARSLGIDVKTIYNILNKKPDDTGPSGTPA